MKREFNALVRLFATLSAAIFALVAIRRVLIDLQEILGIRVLVERVKKRSEADRAAVVASAKPATIPPFLDEITSPQGTRSILLGNVHPETNWTSLKNKPVSLSETSRRRNPHLLVLGSSGTGKSSYLASLARQDIENNDRAVIVLDSDGDLSNSLLDWMASKEDGSALAARTILLEPGDQKCRFGLNPLFVSSDKTLAARADAITKAFQAINDIPGAAEQFNAMSASILRHCVMLLIAEGKPISDLHKLLSDNDYRDLLLESVSRQKNQCDEYPELLEAWGRYKKLARTDQWLVWIMPVLTRLEGAERGIINVITKTSNNIDLEEVISQKKVLLVKFDRNTDPSLLSSLLVTELMEAAISIDARVNDHNTSLYADRVDSVLTAFSYEALLRDTSKNRIGVIGSAQSLHNLPSNFQKHLTLMPGAILSFGITRKDAELLGPIFFRETDEVKADEVKTIEEAGLREIENERLCAQNPHELFICSPSRLGAIEIQAKASS